MMSKCEFVQEKWSVHKKSASVYRRSANVYKRSASMCRKSEENVNRRSTIDKLCR